MKIFYGFCLLKLILHKDIVLFIYYTKMKKKIRFWFTLVEMLIVILIIGILAGAILPRITGYLAKTRDLKRQTDLRNVAAAIQMYKDQHWTLPKIHSGWEFSPIKYIYPLFSSYLDQLPQDPSKTNKIKLYPCFLSQNSQQGWCQKWLASDKIWLEAGNYMYKTTNKAWILTNAMMLVAKVETPDAANYVFWEKPDGRVIGNLWWHQEGEKRDIKDYVLCNSLAKVLPWEEQAGPDCKYSKQEQLYYIVKIE